MLEINFKKKSNKIPFIELIGDSSHYDEKECLFPAFSLFVVKGIEKLKDENYKLVLENL